MHHQKIAFYVRTSGRDSNPQNSIYNQILLLEQYFCTHYENREYVIYEDNGYTGTNINRPAFNNMIQDIKDKKIDCVLVKDLSRFSRNYIQIGYFLDILMPVFNVRLIAINDNYDSDTVSDGLNIDLALKNIINTYYAKDISNKILSSIKERKLNGRFIRTFFGYKRSAPTSSYLLEIDEEQASIIRRIFSLYVNERKTVSEIALILNNENIPTPNYFKSKEKDKANYIWSFAMVHKILKNENYTGKYTCYIPCNGKMTYKKRASSNMHKKMVYYDKYEPIIDKQMFLSANKLFKTNSVKLIGKTRADIKNPFVNKLKCGICGFALCKISNTNRFSYKCTKDTLGSNLKSHEVFITKDELVDTLQSVFDKYKELYISNKSKTNVKQTEISEKEKYEIYKKYVDGIYTKDEYLELLKKGTTTPTTSTIVSDIFSKDININDDVYGFMNEFVKQIKVYPNKKINIIWDFSIDLYEK